MSIKIKRPAGRPSFVQKMTEEALTGIAEDLISWQKANKRSATGDSQDWTIKITRRGKTDEGIGKNIQGLLIGVDYINYALFGRGKGDPPPYQVILKWMQIRGIKGRNLKGQFKTDRAAAVHIAAAIGDHGTISIPLSESLLQEIYNNNTDEAVNDYLPKIADQSATDLVERFENATKNLKNVQVNITA